MLALAALSVVASGYWSAQHLGSKVSRSDLVDPEREYNKLWIDSIREFGADDDAVVVVEGDSREQVIPVLEEISRRP